MENAIRRIAFHMECSPPSLRSNRIFKLRVNLKFCQDYPAKSGEKTEGHVVRSPRALSQVLPLELKGHLGCRMCLELLLNFSSPRKLSRRSRAPEMEYVDYWKMKGQAAVVESDADTYPSSHCSAACWVINRGRNS
jgi:hypothetical protein